MAGETIERAAIRTPAGVVYDLPKPARHHDVIAHMADRGVEAWPCNQGFTTSAGRFVDRFEAMDIARAAGQLIAEPSMPDRLFSEDIF